jgi:hypothetical protein
MSFKTMKMLDGVVATGPGGAHPNGDADMTFVANMVGGTSCTVEVEGSQDGSTFFSLHSFSIVVAVAAFEQTVIKEKWRYLRGNVTAYIGEADPVTLTKTS